ncbi:hypothetical protein E4T38_04405 [Aureobasidium subglaciale]|nr:hypothetical protein E4T38_04405 [Aureobasidium subglaciale]KAI5224186.1 hypothetical protein E4T40_04181 [Aureobasidium subglaciale]KAI5228265.1 hypothetical protein E4T41_03942 [Aureobasidium subglaciale]KAI5262941.1 hypothetical protein E4T46_04149 [Aureobasidium subglaciale]
MDTLRNAATVAASYVGLGGTAEEDRGKRFNRSPLLPNETDRSYSEGETSHIAGGEAPQNVATGTSQSGVEPVSGKLGRGEAGEPYDAGNLDGDAALTGSSVQDSTSGLTSQSTFSHTQSTSSTGLGSGLTGSSGLTGDSGNNGFTSGPTSSGIRSNTSSSENTTSSKPVSEKVRETFGVGGGNKHGTGLGSREDGPGYGTGSKRDKDGSLGSVVGHGSNPDKYLYNSKTAPGLGGHRISDDFTDSNTRNEGADSLPASLGSDAAAGKAEHSGTHSSSGGLTSGRSENDRYASGGTGGASGTGESLTQKAKDYLPGASSHSSARDNTALAGATAAMAGFGHNQPGHGSSANTSGNTHALPVRTHDSSLTEDRDHGGSSLGGSSLGGSVLTGTGSSGLSSGLTSSSTTGTGSGLTGSHDHSHGLSEVACEAEHEGYKPHGGHPIGEAAHSTVDGKQTWLDYRNDPSLPVARANPADQ